MFTVPQYRNGILLFSQGKCIRQNARILPALPFLEMYIQTWSFTWFSPSIFLHLDSKHLYCGFWQHQVLGLLIAHSLRYLFYEVEMGFLFSMWWQFLLNLVHPKNVLDFIKSGSLSFQWDTVHSIAVGIPLHPGIQNCSGSLQTERRNWRLPGEVLGGGLDGKSGTDNALCAVISHSVVSDSLWPHGP